MGLGYDSCKIADFIVAEVHPVLRLNPINPNLNGLVGTLQFLLRGQSDLLVLPLAYTGGAPSGDFPFSYASGRPPTFDATTGVQTGNTPDPLSDNPVVSRRVGAFVLARMPTDIMTLRQAGNVDVSSSLYGVASADVGAGGNYTTMPPQTVADIIDNPTSDRRLGFGRNSVRRGSDVLFPTILSYNLANSSGVPSGRNSVRRGSDVLFPTILSYNLANSSGVPSGRASTLGQTTDEWAVSRLLDEEEVSFAIDAATHRDSGRSIVLGRSFGVVSFPVPGGPDFIPEGTIEL